MHFFKIAVGIALGSECLAQPIKSGTHFKRAGALLRPGSRGPSVEPQGLGSNPKKKFKEEFDDDGKGDSELSLQHQKENPPNLGSGVTQPVNRKYDVNGQTTIEDLVQDLKFKINDHGPLSQDIFGTPSSELGKRFGPHLEEIKAKGYDLETSNLITGTTPEGTQFAVIVDHSRGKIGQVFEDASSDGLWDPKVLEVLYKSDMRANHGNRLDAAFSPPKPLIELGLFGEKTVYWEGLFKEMEPLLPTRTGTNKIVIRLQAGRESVNGIAGSLWKRALGILFNNKGGSFFKTWFTLNRGKVKGVIIEPSGTTWNLWRYA